MCQAVVRQGASLSLKGGKTAPERTFRTFEFSRSTPNSSFVYSLSSNFISAFFFVTKYFQINIVIMAEIVERVKGTKLVKPIIVGNTAQALPKKGEDNHTHRWTVFLRPYNLEDPSKWIRKVQFKLHESYANCNRGQSFIHYQIIFF